MIRDVEAPPELQISGRITGGKGVLALPIGIARIDGFQAATVRRNHLGATEAEREVGFYRLSARYVPGESAESPPSDWDTGVPKPERVAIQAAIAELGLDAASPAEKVAAIRAYFATRFEYTLYQAEREIAGTALADFLTTSRRGHCEYFASATVMLLREAGVPARYATGNSIQEWSEFERAWVVRLRHAHAWARAWVGGRWIDVDTTPAIWVDVESAEASWFEPLLDRWSWLMHRLREWRAEPSEEGWSRWWGLALLPAIGWILWRNRLRLTRARRDRLQAGELAGAAAGIDSDFFRVVTVLASRGLARGPGESSARWLSRVREREPDDSWRLLRELDALHQRYRFDPLGIDTAARHRLRDGVAAWTAQFGLSSSV